MGPYLSSSFLTGLSDEDIQNYWVGPYNMRVPNRITSIKAEDDCNIITHNPGIQICIPGEMDFKEGLGRTEMMARNPPTEDEYKNKYCVLIDNHYYWKGGNLYW